MSRSTQATFTCPCGTEFTSPVYEYVNTAHDPLLRYTVLAGLLNVATCPNCGRRSALSRPFIYSDPEHGLLAYVHPSTDVPEEGRQIILEKLRDVYVEADIHQPAGRRDVKRRPGGSVETRESKEELPPLRVIFGLDQLHALINGVLSQNERLGRLALSTHSSRDAERGQLLDIARKFASEMQCQVEVEDLPDEYTVWLYGSRRQIGAIMRELAPQS